MIVNAPSSKGFLYRLSRLLARLGMDASFGRMWQMGFPSPHVHYFSNDNLTRLAGKAGFVLEAQTRLPSVAVRGLYAPVSYTHLDV